MVIGFIYNKNLRFLVDIDALETRFSFLLLYIPPEKTLYTFILFFQA